MYSDFSSMNMEKMKEPELWMKKFKILIILSKVFC